MSLALLLLFAAAAHAQVQSKTNPVRESDTLTIDDKGDGVFSAKIKFPDVANYTQIKKNFPDPYVLLRNVLSSMGKTETTAVTVAYDDENRSLTFNANVQGVAVNQNNRWRIQIPHHTEKLYDDSHTLILMTVAPFGTGNIMITTARVELPAGAKDTRLDAGGGFLSYALDHQSKTGDVNIDAKMTVKPHIMSALYKIYGDDQFDNGIYWTAKTFFTNTGTGDITNLKISYQLGEYSTWSPENVYTLIPAGGHVVDLYYPLITKEAATLNGATPVDLEMKYSYTDASGKNYSDSTRQRVVLLGSHQFEYSNVPAKQRTGAWSDDFSNAPLVAAFVTRMDDPVRAFGGIVAQACGGQPAGENDAAAVAYCQALYEQEMANGIVYQWSAGFLEDNNIGQELKYPRDVLRDKSGTCIELALLYASVCETSGLRTFLIVIPGHCFPIVSLPSGALLPVECTGLSGPAVRAQQALNFAQAVQLAQKEVQTLQLGQFYQIDVEDLQRQGVLCPELPAIAPDILNSWGYKLIKLPPPTTTPTNPADVKPPQN